MPNQKFFCTLLLLFAFGNMQAQFKVGFSAGVNLANARNVVNDRHITFSYLARLVMGADIAYYPGEHWGVQSGVWYSGKGWRERYGLNFDTVVTKLDYLEVPLTLAYRLQETAEKNLFVNSGFYGAYGIRGKVSFHDDPRLTYDPFVKKTYKRFDFGYMIESAYFIKKKYGLKVSYRQGLLGLQRPDSKLKNFLFGASLCVFLN